MSTYYALYYHLVFGTKYQMPHIDPKWRDRLHAYLGGEIRTLNGVATIVGGVEDHVHILASLTPKHDIQSVLRDVKRQSSKWVHQEIGLRKFAWQEGYAAFTVSVSQVETVRRYIARQEQHHKKTSFRDEYRKFLEKHGIKFEEKYLL